MEPVFQFLKNNLRGLWLGLHRIYRSIGEELTSWHYWVTVRYLFINLILLWFRSSEFLLFSSCFVLLDLLEKPKNWQQGNSHEDYSNNLDKGPTVITNQKLTPGMINLKHLLEELYTVLPLILMTGGEKKRNVPSRCVHSEWGGWMWSLYEGVRNFCSKDGARSLLSFLYFGLNPQHLYLCLGMYKVTAWAQVFQEKPEDGCYRMVKTLWDF